MRSVNADIHSKRSIGHSGLPTAVRCTRYGWLQAAQTGRWRTVQQRSFLRPDRFVIYTAANVCFEEVAIKAAIYDTAVFLRCLHACEHGAISFLRNIIEKFRSLD